MWRPTARPGGRWRNRAVWKSIVSATHVAWPARRRCRLEHGSDTIVTWRLDRLGRSMRHLRELIEDREARGINLSLNEQIDTTSAKGRPHHQPSRPLAALSSASCSPSALGPGWAGGARRESSLTRPSERRSLAERRALAGRGRASLTRSPTAGIAGPTCRVRSSVSDVGLTPTPLDANTFASSRPSTRRTGGRSGRDASSRAALVK